MKDRSVLMSEAADEIAAIAEEIAARGSRSPSRATGSLENPPQTPVSRSLKISVACKDALEFEADVLILKYAQDLYGVDKAAVNLLTKLGLKLTLALPRPGRYLLENTLGGANPNYILFVGVKPLVQFSYEDIRDFSWGALSFLARKARNVRSLALTIHGANYGLDEVESFNSEIAGILDAVSNDQFPTELESITFVEKDERRARRLENELDALFPTGIIKIDDQGSVGGARPRAGDALRTAGSDSSSKPFIFVAMPFTKEMDDVFHYGIRGAINSAGYLCERADLSAFTGDILHWVKSKISGSTLVVADLSTANPNVYLEVGYAWGCNIPTVLIVRELDELKFDVRGHKCLRYSSIKTLEDSLKRELQQLPKLR